MAGKMGSRQKPWPYDVILDADGVNGTPVGFMLKPQTDGQLVAKKAQPIQAQPADYEYSSSSPFLERTVEFQHLSMGMGERIQPQGESRRYRYGYNVDTSINGEVILGPYFHSVTIEDGKPIVGFIEAGAGGQSKVLLAMAEDQLYQSEDDGATWTQTGINNGGDLAHASVLGSGATFNNAVRFTHSGASAKDRVYFGCTAGTTDRLVYADFTETPALFSIAGSAQGPFSGTSPDYVEVVGRELWVGKGNLVSKCEADPLLAASYSGTFSAGKAAGDASTNITWLKQNLNSLYIFKENGIFTMNTDGSTNELFPGLRAAGAPHNGKNSIPWMNSLYICYGDGFFRLNPNGALESIGAELLLSNDSEVSGRPVCWAGHNTWFLYEALYNSETENTYLCKFGSWNESDDGRLNDVVQFRETHHGALAVFEGKKATTMLIFDAGDQQRLIIGFDDGTAAYCDLPRDTPNPAAPNAGCEFTPSGYINLPLIHAGYKADQKLYRGFSIFGAGMSQSNVATIQYRSLESNEWQYLQTDDTPPQPAEFVIAGQRIDFPSGTTPRAKYLDVRVNLSAPATEGYPAASTPRIEGIGVHLQVRPAFVLEYIMTVQAMNHMARHDGTVDRRSALALRNKAIDVASRIGTCQVMLPHETMEELSFLDYGERKYSRQHRLGIEYEIDLRGIQYRTLSSAVDINQSNIWTYADLEAYTYGQLEGLNIYG